MAAFFSNRQIWYYINTFGSKTLSIVTHKSFHELNWIECWIIWSQLATNLRSPKRLNRKCHTETMLAIRRIWLIALRHLNWTTIQKWMKHFSSDAICAICCFACISWSEALLPSRSSSSSSSEQHISIYIGNPSFDGIKSDPMLEEWKRLPFAAMNFQSD